jgi:hypothetical protein
VCNFGGQIAGRNPGEHWVTHWLSHHQKELKTGYLTLIDKSRKKADLALYYSLYFELLGRKIQEYEIQTGNSYNMDEKGFLISFLQKAKRIFTKKAFKARKIKHIVQDGNRE